MNCIIFKIAQSIIQNVFQIVEFGIDNFRIFKIFLEYETIGRNNGETIKNL